MNKHFEDTRYYLKRARETATQGVSEELEPLRERFESITGGDDEPEDGRVEELRSDLEQLQNRAEGEAKEAIADAREKLSEYRDNRSSS